MNTYFISRLRTEWFGNVRGDVLAGLVVALALIPEAIAFSIILGLATGYFGWPKFYYHILSALAVGSVFVSLYLKRGDWFVNVPRKEVQVEKKFFQEHGEIKLLIGAILLLSGTSMLYLLKGSGFWVGAIAILIGLIGIWFIYSYISKLFQGNLN